MRSLVLKNINFTEEQKAILNLIHGEHLVLAPPGTGKTELLAERVVRALDRGVKQVEMMCLTFTNRAAENMVNRVFSKVGENDVFIGNIHKWCIQFLFKKNIIPRNMSLLDEEDSSLIAREIKNSLEINSKHRIEDFLKFSTYVKQDRLKFPNEIRLYATINDVVEKKLYKFHDEYEKIKKKSLFIDFDDLLTLTYDFLRNDINPCCCSWMQVDEVQDLNPMQWAIIDLITNKDSHRVFFGDYEQAIFSFMGAKVDSLSKIEERGSKTHYLSKNFRSPESLINLFNTYAKELLQPEWKNPPVSSKSICNEVRHSLHLREILGNQYEEAKWIVNSVLPREPEHSTAILVRTNKAADMYAELLEENGVKFFKVSGYDIFRTEEVKDLFSFFQTLINNEDRISWARILWRYGNVKTLNESRRIINSMFEIGMRPTDFISLYPNDNCLLEFFYNMFMENRIVVFDTETTGLDVENDDIIQIAAIEIVRGVVGKEFVVYINTDKDLTKSEKIHHISKNFLNRHGVSKDNALIKFKEFVGDDVLVAHNVQYDKEILFFNYLRERVDFFSSKTEFIDSIDLTKRLFPDLVAYKLEYLIRKFDIEGENSHNAIDDVRATVNLLFYFKNTILKDKNSRIEFISQNELLFSNFKKKYMPLYNSISSNFSNEMPLHEVTAMVLGYMEDLYSNQNGEKLYNKLYKIISFMKAKCNIGKVLNVIKKYVPEFSRYSEVDLLIGDEKIFIATIHKAKGLEFENVIVPQVVDGTFPSFFSKSKKEKKEDARILYVAMTRAKTNLLITFHTQYLSDCGAIYPKYISPFLGDSSLKSLFSFKKICKNCSD